MKNFTTSQIENIADMTDNNDHSGVLVFMARVLNNNAGTPVTQCLHDELEEIAMKHELISYMTPELMEQRTAWTAILKIQLFKHTSNAQTVWDAL